MGHFRRNGTNYVSEMLRAEPVVRRRPNALLLDTAVVYAFLTNGEAIHPCNGDWQHDSLALRNLMFPLTPSSICCCQLLRMDLPVIARFLAVYGFHGQEYQWAMGAVQFMLDHWVQQAHILGF